MNHPQHDHSGHHQENKARRQFHKDWRVWLAVIVMLAALATYILTNDETLAPAPAPQQPAPAVPVR
jgi:hypothetical protein